jgi:hypothetical protein
MELSLCAISQRGLSGCHGNQITTSVNEEPAAGSTLFVAINLGFSMTSEAGFFGFYG